ncbi:hypothetical protein [Candidatus Atelocyanobacterium thalassae]|uniref:Uncharacterized protein n=2 Tax=Candidatus Atelocyanobacterium thalassae TaxID=713887 RepID=A0A086CGQ1_9CHRO|nr:hypothetical protein [Candidatus Atelocyanobacterium thalassa]KFF41365.1 MAG: hypothetical protein ucyna2_00787 [Candidatus Atelocyanobacterium thalassa isolate SIO64986]BDA39192.1 hypothetical protein CPARK_000003100 [cyanobacterium endosymbiont of Braarudosphaera bigelowii]
MISIDLALKYTPIPISVHRKEVADAEILYQEIVAAMKSSPQLIELTCEKQTEKKVAVMSDHVGAVIISQKDSNTANGKAPGFFSLIDTKD